MTSKEMLIITTDQMSYDHMAAQIIQNYTIEKPVVSYIRHNENLTYHVVDGASGQKYLVRIHQAAYASMTGIQHTLPALEAEMNLLHELNATTALRVQHPVRNASGEWVTVWTSEAGKEICCTVLEWIEGRDIQQGERLTTEQIYDLGAQLQMLHQYGRMQNQIDRTKVRPAYGNSHENLVMLGQLEEGVRLGIFTTEDFDLLRETFENINEQLETYPHHAGTWGIIHGDITRNNLLITEQGISMIDFCLHGYGYYLFDAGGAALMFNREERDIFLSGYTQQIAPLTDRDIRLMEGFMLIFTLGYYAFQMANESRHEWMKDRMPKLCSKYCRPYVQNESIFYEL
ncbi:Ser/Thr protein kinase RdoA (MazF antagonist) [Paenibacillus xylanexedens]|uniref:phosphotransferase enzyme family protein n=1 Tax=Paenibacillus xylanexedens TaxID=528191 RepID=UPI0020A02D2E|nr:phosphotransferase [Paenibacillus xylanexedens]MCP1424397.1 Ser/Thr protein kinase RdoA (MazF antagonist) [Paenibacillus xylanexedens]